MVVTRSPLEVQPTSKPTTSPSCSRSIPGIRPLSYPSATLDRVASAGTAGKPSSEGYPGPKQYEPSEHLADQRRHYRDVEQPGGRHGLRDLERLPGHPGKGQRRNRPQKRARK